MQDTETQVWCPLHAWHCCSCVYVALQLHAGYCSNTQRRWVTAVQSQLQPPPLNMIKAMCRPYTVHKTCDQQRTWVLHHATMCCGLRAPGQAGHVGAAGAWCAAHQRTAHSLGVMPGTAVLLLVLLLGLQPASSDIYRCPPTVFVVPHLCLSSVFSQQLCGLEECSMLDRMLTLYERNISS